MEMNENDIDYEGWNKTIKVWAELDQSEAVDRLISACSFFLKKRIALIKIDTNKVKQLKILLSECKKIL